MSGSKSYIYSQRNQLKGYAIGATSGTLYYDPPGRLDYINGTGVQTTFDYDGDRLADEGTYGVSYFDRRYVFGASTDEPLVWYEGSGTTDRRFLVADERGSIVAVTDASGAKLAINTYDEYGIPGSGNMGRFQYTGQAWIPELGMYYYKARMYSPTLGRFMQTDPVGYGDGMNWYNYVGGDPVNGSDPSGLANMAPGGIGHNCDIDGLHCDDIVVRSGGGSYHDMPFGGGGFGYNTCSNGNCGGLGLGRPDGQETPATAPGSTDIGNTLLQGIGDAINNIPSDADIVVSAVRKCGLGCWISRLFSGHIATQVGKDLTVSTSVLLGGEIGLGIKGADGLALAFDADRLAADMEALGGGAPRLVTTPKGASQFIFPNGAIVRFDIEEGQFLSRQGPHINLENFPGSSISNIHINLR